MTTVAAATYRIVPIEVPANDRVAQRYAECRDYAVEYRVSVPSSDARDEQTGLIRTEYVRRWRMRIARENFYDDVWTIFSGTPEATIGPVQDGSIIAAPYTMHQAARVSGAPDLDAPAKEQCAETIRAARGWVPTVNGWHTQTSVIDAAVYAALAR